MKCYIFLTILWSSVSFAAVENRLLSLDKTAFPLSTVESSLTNTPRVRTQGAFNVCYGFSSATVAQYFLCNYGVKKVQQCSSVPAKQEISPLSMVGFSNRTRKDAPGGFISNHYNIKFGGVAAASLSNMSTAGMGLAESCYPFDPLAQKYGNDEKAADQMLERVKNLYESNKGKTEGQVCLDCISKVVQEDLQTNANITDIKNALKLQSFEEFLYAITLGKNKNGCEDVVELEPSPVFKAYPALDDVKQATSDEIVSKAREVLKLGYPLALDGICPIYENGKCKGLHSVVITGFREQCTADKKKCKKVLRIQNSWGEEWQRKNDDGWIDAETILGSKNWGPGTLTWLQKG